MSYADVQSAMANARAEIDQRPDVVAEQRKIVRYVKPSVVRISGTIDRVLLSEALSASLQSQDIHSLAAELNCPVSKIEHLTNLPMIHLPKITAPLRAQLVGKYGAGILESKETKRDE
jgi:hypothetical protein